MRILKTDSQKHWAIDGLNSDKKNNLLFEEILINSIQGDIEKYKATFPKNETIALNQMEGSNNNFDPNIKFEVPRFAKSFLVNDTRNYFTKAQNWIGHVIEKTETGFIAKLNDLTQKGTDEIGTFETNEVSEEDQSLINIGAAFYWSVGFANSNGQRKAESFIRFQRFSPWSEEDFNEAADRANRLNSNLHWD